MTTSRILVRVLLVAAICGVLWLGYRGYARSQPDFYWNRAQAAIEAKQWQEAQLNLQNLLQRYPEHGEGLKKMAEVQLEVATENAGEDAGGRKLRYSEVPAALAYLASAAEHLPKDAELQQQVLSAFVQRGQMGDAAQVAKRVLEDMPDNALALYAVAYAAVDSENIREAEETFEKLRTVKTRRRVFSEFALQAQMYQQSNDPEKAEKAIAEALSFANQITPEQLKLLTGRDRVTLSELLVQAASNSKDAAMAQSRVDDGLSVLETLSKNKLLDEGAIALSASRLALVLDVKFPPQADDVVGREERAKISQRAAALAVASTESKVAEPAIYYQAAMAAFSKPGKAAEDKAFQILEDGLKACESIDESRHDELLNLNLLAARRYVRARRFDDAERHINILLQNEDASGWAHLLAGAVAISEGKHEQALEQYRRAQQKMGNTILIRMGLANTHLILKQWKDALPHLEELHVLLGDLDEEEKAWVQRELGSEDNVHLGQLTAYLALKEWDKAQPHLNALSETPLAEPAWTMAVSFLWENKQRPLARGTLTKLREKYPGSVRLLRADAQMLTAVGQGDKIPALIRRFAAKNPDMLVAQLMVVRQALAEKKPQEALDRLEAVPKAIYSKENEQRAVNALRAQALLALDRPDAALALAETLDSEQANLIGAAVKVKEQDIAGAAKLVGKAGQRSGYLKMLEGQLLASEGDYDSAVDAFAKSLDVTAIRSAARGQVMKALLLMARTSGPAAAEAKADELLKAYPEDTVLLIAKAEFKVQQGEHEDALALLDQVETLDPGVATGPYLKAALWLKRKDFQKAYSETQRALQIEPDHALALAAAAEASLAQRQFTRAAEIAGRGVAAHPGNWRHVQLQYVALRSLEKNAEATKLIEDTIANHPQVAEAYIVRGDELIAAKRQSDALDLYRKGQEEAPEAFPLVVAEVRLLAVSGEHQQAVTVADRKFDEEKLGSSQAVLLGQAFSSATLWEESEKWGKKAEEMAKDDQARAVAIVFRGDTALKEAMVDMVEEKNDVARGHFERALKIIPNHFIAGNNLAWLLATKYDKADEAAKICDRVRGDAPIEVMPVAFVDTLCEVYRRCGRDDDARGIVEEAMKANPEDAALQFHFGVLTAKSDPVRAAQALTTALRGKLSLAQQAEAKRVLATLMP